MSTQIQAPKAPSRWRRWRTARPFWGGLLVILSGIEILLAVKAPLPVVLHVGMQGLVGYLVPLLLLLCGILLLVNPTQRLFYSTVAAVLTLASWATSNLGGFVFGMLLGLVGSALAFAWTSDKRKKPGQARTKTPAPPPAPPPGWTELSEPPASPESAEQATPAEQAEAEEWPEATAWPEPETSPAPEPEAAPEPGTSPKPEAASKPETASAPEASSEQATSPESEAASKLETSPVPDTAPEKGATSRSS